VTAPEEFILKQIKFPSEEMKQTAGPQIPENLSVLGSLRAQTSPKESWGKEEHKKRGERKGKSTQNVF